MNIRIGNDITLNITLDSTKMSEKTILKAVCHLVSVANKPHTLPAKSYIPTEYTIHGCGTPSYNVLPANDPRSRGLSVYADKPMFGGAPEADSGVPTIVSNTSLTYVFKAENLKFLGAHKLIVELVVNDSSYTSTYAFDYGTVFSLTDKAYGQLGTTTVAVPNLTGSVIAINPISNIVAIDQNTSISVNNKDTYNNEYGYIVALHSNSITKYTPIDWAYSDIKFVSADPTIVTVDDNGTITAGTTKTSRDVVVTAYDDDNLDIKAEVIVHVNGSESNTSAMLYSTQVYDPTINLNQSIINSQLNASIAAMENIVGKTIDDMFVVVVTQNKYDQLASLNLLRNNTFYYTYDSSSDSDSDDTEASVTNHILTTSGTVSNGILTVSGTVTNHILTL